MRILLIALVVLGLFIFGCVQQPATSGGEVKTETKYVCSDGTTIVSNITLCPPVTQVSTPVVTPTLTLEQELSICVDMPTTQQGSFEDICYMMIAAKHENTSLCRKVATNTRLQCYTSLAEIKDDANVCAEAGTYKDNCYSQYAMNVGDSSVCDKIIEINSKDSCYSNLASKMGQSALCDKITNINQKDNCYLQIAMRTSDSSWCDKITSSTQKQSCLQNIQGMQK